MGAEEVVGEEEPEPQPGPSRKQDMDPAEWGEMLGVFSGSSLEQEPVVLYCFETLDDSDAEDNSS